MVLGLCYEKSRTYMAIRHCKEGDDCYIETPAEEDDAEEIPEDATTFATGWWDTINW